MSFVPHANTVWVQENLRKKSKKSPDLWALINIRGELYRVGLWKVNRGWRNTKVDWERARWRYRQPVTGDSPAPVPSLPAVAEPSAIVDGEEVPIRF